MLTGRHSAGVGVERLLADLTPGIALIPPVGGQPHLLASLLSRQGVYRAAPIVQCASYPVASAGSGLRRMDLGKRGR